MSVTRNKCEISDLRLLNDVFHFLLAYNTFLLSAPGTTHERRAYLNTAWAKRDGGQR